MGNILDFSSCETALRFYGGSEQKMSIKYNGEIYMMKFPKKATERERLDISYTNNIYSEYLGCHIMGSLGFDVQKTLLGVYHDKEVILCKDFVEEGYHLYEFAMIKNSIPSEQGTSGYGTELSDILETIDEQTIYPPDQLKAFFWDMFIADALIGNFDRHNGNWGFLINEKTTDVKLAPIYDCGSCFFPKLSDDQMNHILGSSKEIEKRIYEFPNSAIKIDGKKINYFDFINSFKNRDCTEALMRMHKKVDLDKVNQIIDDMPQVSAVRQGFYKVMTEERYDGILDSSIQQIKRLAARQTLVCENTDEFER